MSLDAIFGIAGSRLLIIGRTPIGEAAETLFAQAGATVEAIDVDPEEQATSAAVEGFAERHGGLDVLVYAATRIGTYALPTMTTAQWDAIHDTNLRGAFLAFRAAIPIMQGTGGGAIVAVSTMGARHPVLKGNAAYGASKAGLGGLVRAAALDHLDDRIRVNAVLAGAVAVGTPPADIERLGGPAAQPGRLALGMGEVQDVAAAILYLVSPAARFITGQELTLDGGFLIS